MRSSPHHLRRALLRRRPEAPSRRDQQPTGSTLRSRRGAGCCPSFLHSAQLTAARGAMCVALPASTVGLGHSTLSVPHLVRSGACARPHTRSDAGRLKSGRVCCTASSIQWCAGPCLAVQAVRRLRCFSTSERCLGAAASEGRTPGRIPYQPRCNLYRSGSKNFLSFLLFLGKKSVCRFFQWGIIETGKSDADRRRGHPDSPLITESVPRRTGSGGDGPCM